jgi:spermidine synthase
MPLFAATIFLSAFLLFQVQPLVARFVLPWFGGTPAVWTTCMLFFQLLLFGGYAYADFLVRRLPSRGQKRVHLALLGLAVAALAAFALFSGVPLAPPAAWKPAGSGRPVLRILGLLSLTAGLPYFLLASTGPLLQAWLSRLAPPARIWRLYALSNLGSLLALVAYPFVIEPNVALRTQAWVWSAAFLLFALGAGASAGRQAGSDVGTSAESPVGEDDPEPSRGTKLLWAALAFCGSLLLLATTSQMCQEVAVFPLLWILPLALYLLSFVLCFELARFPWRPVASLLFVASLPPVCYVLFKGATIAISAQLGALSATLFAGCLVCHGELYRLRPSPRHLTTFYLVIAAGGALGGAFAGVAAPLLFDGYWEYQLSLVVTALLLLVVLGREEGSFVRRHVLARLAVLVALGGLVVALGLQIRDTVDNTSASFRNFYGVLRVKEELPEDEAWHLRALTHGRIRHGFQYVSPDKKRIPTTYYTDESGVGLAVRFHPRRESLEFRIGVVGLGVGTLAAYGRAGDVVRFYEINPDVIALSKGKDPRFTYLSDTPARVEVVEGDARLSLERERTRGEPQRFDVLVLDAFTSDAIPLHLLTAEAFETWLGHLRDADSILAVHISNRHLVLEPVLRRVADHFSLAAALVDTNPEGHASSRSVWVLLARNSAVLTRKGIEAPSKPLTDEGRPVALFTDDYSNLVRLLVW